MLRAVAAPASLVSEAYEMLLSSLLSRQIETRART